MGCHSQLDSVSLLGLELCTGVATLLVLLSWGSLPPSKAETAQSRWHGPVGRALVRGLCAPGRWACFSQEASVARSAAGSRLFLWFLPKGCASGPCRALPALALALSGVAGVG